MITLLTRFFLIGGLLLLSIAATKIWYTPVTLPVSDIEQIRVRLEIHEMEILLDDRQAGQLIEILRESELNRSGVKPVLFVDHTTCIQCFGKGLDEACNPASFYILDDRPEQSFAEMGGKKYKIKDIRLLSEFVQRSLKE
jgi:hypothetical protein